jgi:hypothetical protein
MKSKFNLGDKIVCVSVTPDLRKGKHYEVVDLATNMVAIIDETGGKFYYSDKRFITPEQWKDNLRLMLLTKTFENESARDLFLSELSFRW